MPIVPTVELPPGIPFTDHVTFGLILPVPCTVAVNDCEEPAYTFCDSGSIVTELTRPKTRFACEVPDLVESALLTAFMTTAVGAVKYGAW